MSFESLLINTCTIQRFAEGVEDAYGNSVKTWNNLLLAVPCRWSTPTNREIKVGIEVVIADLILFLLDVDITVQDRVVLDIETYEILAVIKRQDGFGVYHRECLLRIVK